MTSPPPRKGGSRIQDPGRVVPGGGGPPPAMRVGGSMIRDSRHNMVEPGKRVGKYLLGRTIGEGTYGKVKSGKNLQTGETVAIKVLLKDDLKKNGMMDGVNREISFLRKISHPNIVNLTDVLASSSKLYLVMELVNGGDVFEVLARTGRFEEPTARRYFRQLVTGLEYCHAQGIAHRDLKPENLLLSADGTLKISDFGLSVPYRNDGGSFMLDTTCGTVNYMAPEVIQKAGYNGASADIWSCGVILFVFLAGALPFDDERFTELSAKIIAADYDVPVWFSADARDLIARILQPDPKHRASLADIVAHPWFTEGGTSQRTPCAIPLIEREPETSVPAFEKVVEDPGPQLPLRQASGLKSITVFELIAMTHSLDVTRLISGDASTRDQDEKRLLSRTNFIVQCSDPKALLGRLKEALNDIFYPKIHFTCNDEDFMFHIRASNNVSNVTMSAQMFRVSETLLLVHFVRVSGDTFAFNKFYIKIRDKITHGRGFIIIENTGAGASSGGGVRASLMAADAASRTGKSVSMDHLPSTTSSMTNTRARLDAEQRGMAGAGSQVRGSGDTGSPPASAALQTASPPGSFIRR
jgi:serine/threonine protein kinase